MGNIIQVRNLPHLDSTIEMAMRELLSNLPDDAPWGRLIAHFDEFIKDEIRKRNSFCIMCPENEPYLPSVVYFRADTARNHLQDGRIDDIMFIPYINDYICEVHRTAYGVDEILAANVERERQQRAFASKRAGVLLHLTSDNFKLWLKHSGRKGEFSTEDAQLFLTEGHKVGLFEGLDQVPYGQFLKSEYWLVVSSLVKDLNGNCCESCGGVKKLQAHHHTYEHRGFEHQHMNDLAALCVGCHASEHARLKREGVKL